MTVPIEVNQRAKHRMDRQFDGSELEREIFNRRYRGYMSRVKFEQFMKMHEKNQKNRKIPKNRNPPRSRPIRNPILLHSRTFIYLTYPLLVLFIISAATSLIKSRDNDFISDLIHFEDAVALFRLEKNISLEILVYEYSIYYRGRLYGQDSLTAHSRPEIKNLSKEDMFYIDYVLKASTPPITRQFHRSLFNQPEVIIEGYKNDNYEKMKLFFKSKNR